MTWETGNAGSVVSKEKPFSDYRMISDDEINYYGGYLIAESIPNMNIAKLIASAPEMKELLSIINQLESSFYISLPPKISERIKEVIK